MSATFLWSEIASNATFDNGLMPVNMVLLAVLAGILGLVLSGFTGWHISLAWYGQTTIECLEKTRYLSPLRKSMRRAQLGVTTDDMNIVQKYGQQLAEIHANALPGITRVEEGEEQPLSNGSRGDGLAVRRQLHTDYNERERLRERARYEDYLDENESEKLPHAFDLGWKRNLLHLFGDKPLLWFVPICNSYGDGWHWEPSSKWLEAREEVRHTREAHWREQDNREHRAGWGRAWNTYNETEDDERHYLPTSNGVASVAISGTRSPGKVNKILGRTSNQYVDIAFADDNGRPGSGMSMRTLRRKSSFSSRDEEDNDYDEVEDET